MYGSELRGKFDCPPDQLNAFFGMICLQCDDPKKVQRIGMLRLYLERAFQFPLGLRKFALLIERKSLLKHFLDRS